MQLERLHWPRATAPRCCNAGKDVPTRSTQRALAGVQLLFRLALHRLDRDGILIQVEFDFLGKEVDDR